ncbi:MAG: hypothetical protein AB8B73_06835 [Ekhidna sp.]
MKNIFLILLVGLLSCKTSKKSSDQPVDIDQIANELLKEKGERSDMGDKALFYTTNKTPGVLTRTFLVLSITDGKTIHGPQKLNGEVEWSEENILRVNEYVGVIKDANQKDDNGYYYNVLTKKKFTENR